jgi:phosphate-selective porin OprO and OprP
MVTWLRGPDRHGQRKRRSGVNTLVVVCLFAGAAWPTMSPAEEFPLHTDASPADLTLESYEALTRRLNQLETELQALKQQTLQDSDRPDGKSHRDRAEFDFEEEPIAAASAELLPPSPAALTAPLWSSLPGSGAAASPPPSPAAAPIKYPNVQVNGFFQADGLYFDQNDANRETLAIYQPPGTGQPLGDIQDGAGFRRTRLSAKGAVAPNVNYMIQMDFGFFGRPTFTDVWGEVTDVPVFGNVRAGQWKQPFGLESITSVRYQTFLERSLLFQPFEAFRHVGIGFYNHSEDEHCTWALSVFRLGQDQFGNDIADNGGASTAGRITWLPYFHERPDKQLQYVHVGGAFWFADPGNDRFRFATIPEAYVGAFGVPAGSNPGTSKIVVPSIANGTPPFADTGNLPVNTFTNLGTELLWVDGPLSTQSELQVSNVALIGDGMVTFWGLYHTVSWFATGESRPYDRKQGCLDRVTPRRPFLRDKSGCGYGPGAWEFAVRASYVDLDDGVVTGGRVSNVTSGVNWYLNGFTKVQFNYVHSLLSREPVGLSHANIFGVRAQVDF